MDRFPEKLINQLHSRQLEASLRTLSFAEDLVDFSSNDYLGFASHHEIFRKASSLLESKNLQKNGSTGSRLLTGNSAFYEETEAMAARFHGAGTCTIFNSGYTANTGFFSCIPQKGDTVFYDEFIHASVRDGIRMSNAKAFKFRHNDLWDLKKKAERIAKDGTSVFIVTESIFSMDGDSPDIKELASFSNKNNYFLVIDEAHALGISETGRFGKVAEYNLQQQVFATIVTFGKALGCHGAAVLGSSALKEYLINFSRPFIYSTALPPHALATIQAAYGELEKSRLPADLQDNIYFFKEQVKELNLCRYFIPSHSAVHSCVLPGNENVKKMSLQLREKGFDVKAVLSPTVPKGAERLRFCLHSFNSREEINAVLTLLANFF